MAPKKLKKVVYSSSDSESDKKSSGINYNYDEYRNIMEEFKLQKILIDVFRSNISNLINSLPDDKKARVSDINNMTKGKYVEFKKLIDALKMSNGEAIETAITAINAYIKANSVRVQ